MFTISRIGPLGDRELRAEASTDASALEDISSALKLLKTLPSGTKIEIFYDVDQEEETASTNIDK